jgi:hypothetical protein
MSVDETSGCMYSFKGINTTVKAYCRVNEEIIPHDVTVLNSGLSKIKYGQIIHGNDLALIVVNSNETTKHSIEV